MQMPTGKKLLMPIAQQTSQNMDALRSAPVQDHVQTIRKSQSADSITSKLQDDEHGSWFSLKMNCSFERKTVLEVSTLTVKNTKSAQNMVATVAPVESGTKSSSEEEHELDFWDTMPSSEVAETSCEKNHPHVKDDAVEGLMNMMGSVLWMKMKEPSFPIYLKFSDVGYKVISHRGPSPAVVKPILQGVTGFVEPGEVLALMGPTGGGKTTLLNLLSGRMNMKDPRGSITYNDKPYCRSLKRRIGFVLQDDIVFPHLTVRETLTYSAFLRLPKTLTKQQKEERAMNVIFELGLERCQDTIIGGAYTRGISGGERKRVCIGNEILLDPSLLFLDEPTSGLDSTTALRLLQMLHNMAQHAGKTVVTTIHQPSSRLFNMFDKLILLSKGTSLYFGKASEAMLYFSSIGCSPLIPMNPAEFLIDLANGNMNDKSISLELENRFLDGNEKIKHHLRRSSSMDIHEYLVAAYETKCASKEKQNLLIPASIDTRWMIQGGSNPNESRISWLQQCQILFCRGLKERRHEYLSCIQVIQAGLLFFISVFWGYFPIFAAIFTFPKEHAMLIKERSVDMYKLSAYFLARTMSDLPLDLILPMVFLLIVYFMAGLKSDFRAFLESTLTIFLSIVAAQGLGLAIGAALMDVKKATTLASVIIMTFMLAGGFFIQRVPFFMSWIRYLSFNYHAYRLLLKAQYGCTNASQHSSNNCKSPFVKHLGLGDGGIEVGAMIAMAIGYRLLAYLFLRMMKVKSS